MPFVGTGATLPGWAVPTNLSAKLLGLLHVLDVDADASLRNIIRDENGDAWGIDMSGAFHEIPEKYRGKVAEMPNSPFRLLGVAKVERDDSAALRVHQERAEPGGRGALGRPGTVGLAVLRRSGACRLVRCGMAPVPEGRLERFRVSIDSRTGVSVLQE
jgi:hypothetical protein